MHKPNEIVVSPEPNKPVRVPSPVEGESIRIVRSKTSFRVYLNIAGALHPKILYHAEGDGADWERTVPDPLTGEL